MSEEKEIKDKNKRRIIEGFRLITVIVSFVVGTLMGLFLAVKWL